MITNEQIAIEFYKNGSALNALERFSFSEKEEKLIRDAIRTANMQNPRMKLIDEADLLLKEVAKTREPIIKKSGADSTEAFLLIDAMKLEQEQNNINAESFGIFSMSKTKIGRTLFVSMTILLLVIWYYVLKYKS